MNPELVAAFLTAAQAHIEAAQASLNALAAHLNAGLAAPEGTPIATNAPTGPPQSPEGCVHPPDRQKNLGGFAGPRKFFCRDCRRKYVQSEKGEWAEFE